MPRLHDPLKLSRVLSLYGMLIYLTELPAAMTISRFAILILSCLVSVAHSESWHEDPISGCKVWDDEDLEDRQVILSWSTGCDAEGNAAGDGVLTWLEDGQIKNRYLGPMVGGKANGWGVAYVLTEDGSYTRYEGLFKDSEIDGHVRIDTADNRRYEGTYNSVTKSGSGVASNAAGDRYTGEIENEQMHGQGYLERANGERYRGEFVAGEVHGHGEWMDAAGDYYVGDFVNGEMSGGGRLERVNGGVYEGDFLDGLPHGTGTYTAPDGKVMEGQFMRGWPSGEVDVTTSDGERTREVWAEGKRVDD